MEKLLDTLKKEDYNKLKKDIESTVAKKINAKIEEKKVDILKKAIGE